MHRGLTAFEKKQNGLCGKYEALWWEKNFLDVGHRLKIKTHLYCIEDHKQQLKSREITALYWDHLAFLQESVPPELFDPVNLQEKVSEAPSLLTAWETLKEMPVVMARDLEETASSSEDEEVVSQE